VKGRLLANKYFLLGVGVLLGLSFAVSLFVLYPVLHDILFPSSSTASSPEAVTSPAIVNLRNQCAQHCLSMDNFINNTDDAKSLPYCATTFSISEDGNSTDVDHCYDTIITGGSPCHVFLVSGEKVTIDAAVCSSG